MGCPCSISGTASGLGMVLPSAGNPACMHGKPGENENPGEHVREDNKKIPKGNPLNDHTNQKTRLVGQ